MKVDIEKIIFLALAILCSFIILPFLGDTPAFTTGHSLITAGQWLKDGILEHGFIGRMPAGEMALSEGRVYVSYPILAFIIPYLTSCFTNLSLSSSMIESLGLIFHIGQAFLIFKTLKLHIDKKAALIGAGFFLFIPGAMWYNTQIFYADTICSFFALGNIYFVSKILKNNKKLSHWAGHYSFVFLGMMTEYYFWLSNFFLFLFLMLRFLKHKDWAAFKKSWLTPVFTLLSLGLNIYLYSIGTKGIKNFLEILKGRFSSRGSEVSMEWLARSFVDFNNEALGHNLLKLALIIFVVSYIIKTIKKKAFIVDSLLILCGFGILLPFATHMLALQNLFVNHPFLVAKLLPIYAFAVAYGISYFFIGKNTVKSKAIYSVVICIVLLASIINGRDLFLRHFARDRSLWQGAKAVGLIVAKNSPENSVAVLGKAFVESQFKVKDEAKYLFEPMYYYHAKRDSFWFTKEKIDKYRDRNLFFFLSPEENEIFDKDEYELIASPENQYFIYKQRNLP